MTSKKDLSERDICTKFIQPALEQAGWNPLTQIREEVTFTAGRIDVKGNQTSRGKRKRADYILYYKPNIPIAIIEAKDNKHSVRAGIQQALNYAQILDIPSVYSSNGDGFYEHDRSRSAGAIEKELPLNAFPSPETLWQRYKFGAATHIGLTATPKETATVSSVEYFGEPIYTYSLKQGINDGFLAPYKVLRVGLNVDLEGWRPEQGKTDKQGYLVEDRIYNRKDFDRNLVIDERTGWASYLRTTPKHIRVAL